MKFKLKSLVKWLFVYPIVIILCTELAFRIMGYGVSYNDDYKVKATPNNAYIGDEKLGIKLNPGVYEVTLNEKIVFKATHNLDGTRKTIDGNLKSNPSLVFLGCSFTYGYGVNDGNTFASYLQEMFPEQAERSCFESCNVIRDTTE